MQSLLFLIVTLAILVVVHEFGHFWVARRCGVKVLKFSVGFGKPLWSRHAKDGTEYIVAAIPLGGYVKMLDEREGEVSSDELDKAFNRKPLSSRVAIVAAGPIANLLFAVCAYWLIFLIGVPGIRPIISDVVPDSPAAYAQFVPGDEIAAVNGQKTSTWSSVLNAFLRVSETSEIAEVTIKSGASEFSRTLKIDKFDQLTTSPRLLLTQLGIEPLKIGLRPIIASITEGKAADKSGLNTGDLIISVDGELIKDWTQFVRLIQASANKSLNLIVKRGEETHHLVLRPEDSGNDIGHIGAGVDSSKTKLPEEFKAVQRYGLISALGKACYQTWAFSTSTLKSIGGMLTGSVSSENIGGPITIAQYAGKSADRGLISFIDFLAMISISLGLLNLLPIPILDGGHLALYLVEWIRGAPLSEQMQFQIQKVGVFILLMLMFLAFFNDLTRLFG